MKLSEELLWRGFYAETTFKNPADLDQRAHKFYIGADPSAESLTIGNLASLMMCATFARHGYHPFLVVGGATGQVGDPKDTGERDLKSLAEIKHNKAAIKKQMTTVLRRAIKQGDNSEKVPGVPAQSARKSPEISVVDNLDWFKNMHYLEFLREIGKHFSMTQLLDRQFVQARIGEGGSGISYAEFSYTLIQGYDFLNLFREYGVDLQLCGADQFGNCSSGVHLIRTLENATADIWSSPLIVDPISGRKFGKSEGNAVWLDARFTSVFDYYQYWLGRPDQGIADFLKIYTTLGRETLDKLMAEHAKSPERRLAQRALAFGSTAIVHGVSTARKIARLSGMLFGGEAENTLTAKITGLKMAGTASVKNRRGNKIDLDLASEFLPVVELTGTDTDAMALVINSGLAGSKNEARELFAKGVIREIDPDGIEQVLAPDDQINHPCLLRRGKNKFAVVK